MSELHTELCVPCHRGAVPLSSAEIATLSARLPGWTVDTDDAIPKLTRTVRATDFAEALAYVNRIGGLAEEADHHPRIVLEWGRVTISWWTHTIKGLHRNDFIMAARTDRVFASAE